MAVKDEHDVRHRVRYWPAWDPLHGGTYGHTVCNVLFVVYDERQPGVEKMRRSDDVPTCLACVRKAVPFLPYE